ncbi:tetratricopeptide repeat protein [Polyangium sp. 6x1]|uniref:tetratricopeptide repeat protein n=1 Tax=Polyangium sp. 6x1 TaxID=3042689 RepID=UPI0024827724|nr:tetratricopeptide repeat protein [Polyangium sp. 6x1]MDI1447448.1 tetratricopeptide repeat protein [Polyangium sp. 6x1]
MRDLLGLLAPDIMNIIWRIRAKDPTAFADAVEFTEQHPEIWELWHTLAYAYEARGEYTAAIAALTRAIVLSPREPVSFMDRGGCALMAGHYERAMADFSLGLILCDELDWDDYREALHFLRAEAFVQLGKKAEALSDLAHVPHDYVFWTIQVRSKAELLALCGEGAASSGGMDGLERRPEEVITRESLRVPSTKGNLVFEDWAVLPESPDEEESELAMEMGTAGLEAIDAMLLKYTRDRYLKAARVIIDAAQASGVPYSDETRIRLYARRLIVLANAGALEARGNLHRPRFSEVRLPEQP